MSVALPIPFKRFFIPAAKLKVTLDPLGAALPLLVDNPDGSGLRMEWEIKKTISSKKLDTLDLSVHGLAPSTRKSLQAIVDANVIAGTPLEFFLGWDKQTSQVFKGEITSVEPDREEKTSDNAEAITKFKVDDGVDGSVPAALGAFAGKTSELIVADICRHLKLIYSVQAQAVIRSAAAKLPANKFKMLQTEGAFNVLNALMDMLGLSWSIQGGRFVVYELGVNKEALPIVLGGDSGLLTWTLKEKGAIKVTALAVPTAVPGGQVTLLDNNRKPVTGGPVYIEKVTFKGSTDGNSRMTLTCKKLVPL